MKDLLLMLDVIPTLMLAEYHLYSWPESVPNLEFWMNSARVKPVIWSRPLSLPCCVSKVIISCNMLCSSEQPVSLTSSVVKLCRSGLCCRWISILSPYKPPIRCATSCGGDFFGSVRICFTKKQIERFHSHPLNSESGVHRMLILLSNNHCGAVWNVVKIFCLYSSKDPDWQTHCSKLLAAAWK